MNNKIPLLKCIYEYACINNLGLLVVQFQVHSVVNFVVLQGDVILVDGVPLLKDNLLPVSSRLSGNQFF